MNPQRIPVYTNYFEFLRADGDALIEECYRIRYQVYCEERHFLDPEDYPDQFEIDPYDGRSVHFVGRHRFRLQSAGTVRLVLHSDLGFPMQEHCVFDPDFQFLQKPGDPTIQTYAEISRISVSKLFRQRAGDTFYGGPPRSPSDAATSVAEGPKGVNPVEAGPEIVAGLYKCIYQESKRLGLTHWVVAMERGLQLLLRRMGFHFKPVGPTVDYYGPVIPYIARIEEIERAVYERRRAVFDYWMDGLEPEHMPVIDAPGRP